ncbi:MAG: hypothetical protein LBN94_03010 [Puniceicoccales bacterium]|nr:hypothetical protein [Puniceicoccales bacterium]
MRVCDAISEEYISHRLGEGFGFERKPFDCIRDSILPLWSPIFRILNSTL